MKTGHWILYDQLHEEFIPKECTHVLFVISTTMPKTPVGKLCFTMFSMVYEFASGKEFLKDVGRKYMTEFVIAERYLEGILEFCSKYSISELTVMNSSEEYMQQKINTIKQELRKKNINLRVLENKQFLVTKEEFQKQFPKPPIMEFFYRWMRKKTGILMEEGKPEGGKWNFDKDNRKFSKSISTDKRLEFEHSEYLNEAQQFYGTNLDFNYIPLNRTQALAALEYFCEHYLYNFGPFEDAMYNENKRTFHSLLSIPLNWGLLRPMEILEKVLSYKEKVPLQSLEGFVRQVLGWREYMYQFFWYYKASIYSENYFAHTTPLPRYFREPSQSKLKTNCVQKVLERVKDNGYSHHIERLMIIGNFSLLTEMNPLDVNKRFWEQYLDAFERVVTPNVLGMSQFADGGKLATKPYVSSGNYINGMSDFCGKCYYDPKQKTGEKACPFNYLYWNFVHKHKKAFVRQPYITKNLDKVDMGNAERLSKEFLSSLI